MYEREKIYIEPADDVETGQDAINLVVERFKANLVKNSIKVITEAHDDVDQAFEAAVKEIYSEIDKKFEDDIMSGEGHEVWAAEARRYELTNQNLARYLGLRFIRKEAPDALFERCFKAVEQ